MATILSPDLIRREMAPRAHAVRRQLRGVRRRLRSHLLCEGLAWTMGVAALLVALSYVADRFLRLGTGARLALLPIGIAATAAVAYVKLIKPLLLRLHDLDLAVVLDRRVPGVGERVANVLQLPSLLQSDPAASPAMIQAAVLRQADELDRIDWRAPFNRQRLGAAALAIIAPLAVVCAAAFVWPEVARLWASRWFTASGERWPQQTYLSIVGLGESDRLYVPRGESIVVEVDAQPTFTAAGATWLLQGRGKPLVVRRPEQPASVIPEEVHIRYYQAGAQKLGTLTQMSEGRFRYELPPVEELVEFSLYGGDDWLGPITVEPLDRPGIEDLKIESQSPGQENRATHSFTSQESQLLFLPGTQLELSLTSDAPLEHAELVATSGTAPAFERRNDRHYVARWSMSEALTLEIKLVGSQAHLASKPYFISLNLLQDRLPRVAVRASGVGRRVTPQATIPVAVRAMDDFGLTSVGLEVEQMILKEDKPETKIHNISVPLPETNSAQPLTEMESDRPVLLKEYNVAAGNMIKLRGTALDNRAEGSQAGQSRWLSFQVVTPEELFYEILMVQRAQREKFRATLETEKTQVEAIAALAGAEEVSAINRKHQVATRTLWQIANRLEATHQEMTLNDLGSQQARDLLISGIITPIRALHDGGMSQLRGMLDQMAADPGRLAELSPPAGEAQQAIVDEMTKILERMAQWESFVDVLNQVQKIMELQGEVLHSTEKTRTERTNSLFDE